MHFAIKLREMEACEDAVEWAETMPDVRTAYAQCPSGYWLAWLLIVNRCWPGDSEGVYIDQRKPLYDEYYAKCKPVRDAYGPECQYRNVEYRAKIRRIRAEYDAKVADMIRALVPVEVFVRIFAGV